MEDLDPNTVKIIFGLLFLIVYLATNWYLAGLEWTPESLVEAVDAVSRYADVGQTDHEPPLTRYDGDDNQARLRERNARILELLESRVNNVSSYTEIDSQNNEERSHDEIANNSQENEEVIKNSNDAQPPNRKCVWYISDDETICAYGVHGHVECIDINNSIVDNADREIDNNSGWCESCSRRETNSISNYEALDLDEDDNVFENVEEINIEKDNDKTEDSSEKIATVSKDKCDGIEKNSESDGYEQCKTEIISLGDNEGRNVSTCNADVDNNVPNSASSGS